MTVFPTPRRDRTFGTILITSPYGPRWGSVHYGTDIGSTDGLDQRTECYANDAGEVVNSGDARPNGAGIFLWLLTDRYEVHNGIRYRVGYKNFHLAELVVKRGRVKEGELIARCGNTGTSATHLHQQKHLFRDGLPIDWSDRTAVSHTQELQELINAGQFVGEIPSGGPPFEPPITPPISIKELQMTGCVFSVDSGPQVRIVEDRLEHIRDDGERDLLILTLNAEKHPLSPADWVHLDWNNPQHQKACDAYYDYYMPTLPENLQHDDRPVPR